MSESSQVYIHCHHLSNFWKKGGLPTTEVDSYGTDNTTVLVYHNQWRYGHGLAHQALTLLEYQAEQTSKYHVLSAEPHEISDTKELAEALQYLLAWRIDTTMPCLGYHYARAYHINGERADARHEFGVYNNDNGIVIVDALTNSYCFMNIFSYNDKNGTRIQKLLQYVPYSAEAYLRIYYPELEETDPNYSLEKRQTSQELVRRFQPFRVMESNEVIKLFPQMAKQILKQYKKAAI